MKSRDSNSIASQLNASSANVLKKCANNVPFVNNDSSFADSGLLENL